MLFVAVLLFNQTYTNEVFLFYDDGRVCKADGAISAFEEVEAATIVCASVRENSGDPIARLRNV